MTEVGEKIDPRLNAEDFTIPEGIPQPQLWHMLVAPVQPKKKSAGGIIIVDETQDAEEALAFIGKVVALGPLVGKKPEWVDTRDLDEAEKHLPPILCRLGVNGLKEAMRDPELFGLTREKLAASFAAYNAAIAKVRVERGPDRTIYNIKAGDWVVFGRYAGQRFQFKHLKLLLIADDAILAKCDGPEGFRVYL